MEVAASVEGGYDRQLVLVDYLSRYVWLDPAASYSGEGIARAILKWFGFFGLSKKFVSDGMRHNLNKVVKTGGEFRHGPSVFRGSLVVDE